MEERMTGLVFDIDDTLYSRQDLFVKAAESVLGVNVEDPREFVRIFYAKSDLNTAELEAGLITTRECNGWRFEETFIEMGLPFAPGDGVLAADAYLELQSHMSLTEDMKALLSALASREDILLGVLTAGESAHQWNKVDMLGLCTWIPRANIIVAGDVGVSKPDVKIFRLMEERLGLEASDMWMIGDSYKHDIKGAIDAGWHAVWLNRRSISVDGPMPDFEVLDDEDLVGTLRREFL